MSAGYAPVDPGRPVSPYPQGLGAAPSHSRLPAQPVQPVMPAQPRRQRRSWPAMAALMSVGVLAFVATFYGLRALHHHGDESSSALDATTRAEACASPVVGDPPAELSTRAPAPGRTVITPNGAEKVFAAFWEARELALVGCGLDLLRELDDGPALIGDVSRAHCGCLIRTEPGSYTAKQIYLEHQTGYPATFLVEVATSMHDADRTWLERMVFRRNAPTTPWKLVLDTGYASDPGAQVTMGRPITTEDGYLEVVSANQRAEMVQRFRTYARYLQSAKDSGKAPAGQFAPGDWGDRLAEEIAAHPNGTVQKNGFVLHETFRAPRNRDVEVVFTGRSIMACGALSVRSVFTGPDGVTQDAGRYWGPDLDPGVYREVVSHGVDQTCLSMPVPAFAGVLPVASGGDWTNEAVVTGTPV
ncbi:hypothetical protein ACIB24_18425 [Spongisporangium articulatum]|uniref:DUF8094 domain-containing protein n=1 Tax=Spongisporangium articulatum TaxID=3362603 RepID=A0ABW8ARR8_9ACTN